MRLPMQGGPRKKSIACQSGQGGKEGGWEIVFVRFNLCPYLKGEGWVGNCHCEVCFLSIFRREKGGEYVFFADPLALVVAL